MSADDLSYAELNAALLEEFPLLKAGFPSTIGDFPDWEPGPYVVFGSVFSNYIEAGVFDTVSVRSRMANFIERMATSSDTGVGQLLQIELLLTLLKSQQVTDAYWPYLGQRTQRLMVLLAPRTGPEIRLPLLGSNSG